MGRKKGSDDGRVEGEDLAQARFYWYFSPRGRAQHGPPEGWDDPRYVPQEFLDRAAAEPPASTHASCCWCPRSVAAAKAYGHYPMDKMTCDRVHADGVHT